MERSGRQRISASADRPFEFVDVQPGAYQVKAEARSFQGAAPREVGQVAVRVGYDDVDGVVVVTRPGVEVTVRVRAEGETPIDLQSLGLDLRLRSPIGKTIGTRQADADGLHRLRDVHEGAWGLRLFGPYPDWYVSDLRQGGRSVIDDGIIRVGGEPEQIDLTLSPYGATIAGFVRGSARAGIETVRVVLVPDAPRRGNPMLYDLTNPDPTGGFTFRGVGPGKTRFSPGRA